MKYHTRHIAIAYIVGFAFLVLSGGWIYLFMKSSLEEQIYRQFQLDAELKLNGVELVVKRLTEDFRTYTEIPSFKSLHFHELTLNKHHAREDIRQLELYFFELIQHQREITGIRFISVDSTEVFKIADQTISHSLSDLSLFEDIKTALALERGDNRVTIEDSSPESKRLVWWLPVYTSSTIRTGILSFELEFSFLEQHIERITQPALTEASLQDANGQTLYRTNSSVASDNRWSFTRPLSLDGLDLKIIYSGDKEAFLKNIHTMEKMAIFLLLPVLALLFGLLLFITIKRMHAEKRIQQMAYFDSLTGLVNRNHFEERLREAFRHSREDGIEHALLYLDLDQFKIVNDTCGHIAGDQLLKQLAQRLRIKVRRNDTLARLGGDEFALLLEGCPESQAISAANSIRQTIREFRFIWDGRSFSVGTSIGVALITRDTRDIDSILQQADMACYMAKELGRDRIHLYTEGDESLSRQKGEMQWATRLKQALEEDHLFLEAQRIIPTDPNRHRSFNWELLVRLDDDGKTIYPETFLTAAERYGLMPQIDRWVIANAFRFLSELGKGSAGQPERVHLFVNVSGMSLGDPRFLDFVEKTLHDHPVQSGQVCFEITETAAISNIATALNFINRVNSLGFKIALDDFGSGLCSFSYLRTLPVSYLKIDGEFIKRIQEDAMDMVIVKAIKEISDAASLSTIAEFVPGDRVLKILSDLGIDYAQGYGIAMPQPLNYILEELIPRRPDGN